MESLNKRSGALTTALLSSSNAIVDFQKQNIDLSLSEYRKSRDSLIQRFEYCADLFWKFLNDQLRIQMGIFVDIPRPKFVFKESCDTGLISSNELQTCIKLTEDRNHSSHAYHEELAEWISQRIPAYYQLMNTVAQRLIK